MTFLAAASLGAIWSSCSPDFGARAVHDRFAQIEPAVLLAVDGYVYRGKRYDIRATVETLRGQLPTLRATVLVGEPIDDTVSWESFGLHGCLVHPAPRGCELSIKRCPRNSPCAIPPGQANRPPPVWVTNWLSMSNFDILSKILIKPVRGSR